jgi:transcriptional regulator with XRE-family HTH domain
MRRLRHEQALSQEGLAERCGLSRAYLSSVENRQRNVSIDNICRIAAALDVEPDVLLEPEPG